MKCPHCGKDTTPRKALIAELAKVTGVKQSSIENLTIPGATALLEAWKKVKS